MNGEAFLGAAEPVQPEEPAVDPDFVLELSELMRLFRIEHQNQDDWTFDNFMYWVDSLTKDLDDEAPLAE